MNDLNDQNDQNDLNDQNHYGADIRRARVEQGLQQADLARLLGVSAPYVSRLERGGVRESPRIADRCEEVLGVRRKRTSGAQRSSMQVPLPYSAPTEDPYLKLLPVEIPQSADPDVRLWDIPQTIPELSYLTHGFFRYYGKFPPTLARRLIRDFRPQSGEIILDNLMGCGTTLVEARLEGHESLGIDASPLAVLAARVKVTTDLDRDVVQRSMSQVQADFTEQTSEFPASRDLAKWFSTNTTNDLAKLRAAILRLPADDVRQFLTLAFFAIIRRVSFAFDGEVRPHINAAKKPRDVWSAFAKKVDDMLVRLAEYNILVRGKPPAHAVTCDARKPATVLEPYRGRVGLVVSHPPYLNCFDYIPVFRLEYLWTQGFEAELGNDWTYDGLRGTQVKSWPASPAVIKAYFSDLTEAYLQLVPYLSPTARVAVVIGDCTVMGEVVRVLDRLAEDMHSCGFELVRTLLRTTHYGTGKYAYAHRADYHGVAAEKRDGVLVFRRA